jgi:hypothetical protein
MMGALPFLVRVEEEGPVHPQAVGGRLFLDFVFQIPEHVVVGIPGGVVQTPLYQHIPGEETALILSRGYDLAPALWHNNCFRVRLRGSDPLGLNPLHTCSVGQV